MSLFVRSTLWKHWLAFFSRAARPFTCAAGVVIAEEVACVCAAYSPMHAQAQPGLGLSSLAILTHATRTRIPPHTQVVRAGVWCCGAHAPAPSGAAGTRFCGLGVWSWSGIPKLMTTAGKHRHGSYMEMNVYIRTKA